MPERTFEKLADSLGIGQPELTADMSLGEMVRRRLEYIEEVVVAVAHYA